jgi:hypothetical protein
VRAEDAGLVGGSARAVVPDVRELGQSDTDTDNLLSEIFHVLANEIVTGRVEEYGKAPRIPEGDEVGFAREEVDVENAEDGDLLTGNGGLVEAFFHVRG